MNSLYSFIIRQKDILKRIFPAEFLRKCKTAVIHNKVKNYKEKPIDRDIFSAMPKGVNLIGDIRIEIGLGQSMRLIANTLALSKYAFSILNLPLNINVRRNDHTWDHKISCDAPYSINLIHINPLELGDAHLSLGDNVFRNRYNIGFWLWELEEFPKEHLTALKFVDEIWTPSEFASNCFRKVTDKPVYTIPYHVEATSDPTLDRSYFDLPEGKFLYLIMFDFNSTMLRKNPAGAIEAFKRAFPQNDKEVGLVIKINNPTKECLNTLDSLLEGYENVYYITRTLDKAEVNSLIGCVDVFVSLHRAEGFGLVLAEAMLLKTACIATNWSSNTEFMNSDTACMVSYKITQIEKNEGSYPVGGLWADADIDEAAKYMAQLKQDPIFYQKMIERAYSYVSNLLGKEKIVGMLEERIGQIYELLGEA